MQVVLFDTILRKELFPFTHLRPIADIRLGIFTLREKWNRLLNTSASCFTAGYLQQETIPTGESTLFINGSLYPSGEITEAIRQLAVGETLLQGDTVLASRDPLFLKTREAERKWLDGPLSPDDTLKSFLNSGKELQGTVINYPDNVLLLKAPWQLFQYNNRAIADDFSLATRGRKSAPVSPTNRCMAPENIFLEEGVTMEHCILNASEGPIYIGANALLMEGTSLRGPVSIGEKAVVKMGARIYGATTIGPHCTVGGEIKNSILFGYSNKAHDGYLGDAVIGCWCNLGAGTSASNIKNSAGKVAIWNEARNCLVPAANKCGLLMGDHSKAAINTSFNTGTVVGIGSSVFLEGLTPAFIPHFSWGGKLPNTYRFEKAMTDFAEWKQLKGQVLTDWEVRQLKHIFDSVTTNYFT